MENKKNRNQEDAPAKKKQRFICDLPIPEIAKQSGTLLVCGQGDMGQLGLGEDQMERKRPAIIPGLQDVVDIRAGGMHSLCLTKDGEIYSFGCNDEGALGRDTSEEGSEFLPSKVDLPGKCLKITAGDSHSACLLEDGRVFAWGSFRDSHGNMGLTLEGNKRLPIEVLPETKSCDIASGADHLVILTCTGKIYTTGCAEQGQLGRVSLRSASGESRRGKTELLKPAMVNIKGAKFAEKIWATTYCTFVKEYGKPRIFAFGLNNYKQLGLKKTSELVISPTATNFENVKTIAGGQHHTVVLTENKKCYAIGRRDYGRLGVGEISEDVIELIPIKSLEGEDVVNVSCGEAQSFAVTSDGKVYSWGMGSNLQLGTGSEDDELTPVLISSKQIQDKNVIKVSSGGQHTLFLIANESNISGRESKLTESFKSNNEKIKDNTKDIIMKDESDLNENKTTKVIGNGNVIQTKDNDAEDKNKNAEETDKKQTAPAKKVRKRKN